MRAARSFAYLFASLVSLRPVELFTFRPYCSSLREAMGPQKKVMRNELGEEARKIETGASTLAYCKKLFVMIRFKQKDDLHKYRVDS